MEKVVILSATRTPIGRYKGSLASLSAVEIGEQVARSAIQQANVNQDDITQAIIGNVLSAGNGQNVARQIAIKSGLSDTTPAMTINEVCGSGMKAVILAMQQIQLGEAEVILAGGTESMTQAPLLQKYETESDSWQEPVSSMVNDGLTDAFSGQHMGLTAENVAQQFQVSRQKQDQYALASQLKAAKAQAEGKFSKEITPIDLANETVFSQDEGIRGNSSLEKLASLRTVFADEGTVTAGNASTLNDGASMLVLASQKYAEAHQLPYLATIEGFSEIGMDPSLMGIAPIYAIKKLLATTALTLSDIDLFEINEAFAAASVAIMKELQLPEEKINIYGGGISLGHPIGASGARILTTLISALHQENKEIGIASLCIGGGLGLAVLLKKKTAQQSGNHSKKFYQMTARERLEHMVENSFVSKEHAEILESQIILESDIANNMIENQVGEYELPLGIAPNFLINQQTYQIPMVTEEASVIAAASNAAKIIAQSGGFFTKTDRRWMRGQIVFHSVKNPITIQRMITQKQTEIFQLAKSIYPSIVERGGGLEEIQTRIIQNGAEEFLSVDVLVNTKDAMGANIINTLLEGLADQFREWFPEEEILFSILSNLPTEALSNAQCQIPVDLLTTKSISGKEVAANIVAAATYAKLDPYRAATHNKGIMNGIDAVVMATGNDTRAVAAGCHAYAVKNGNYQGLTDWYLDGDKLIGSLTLPIAVGTVGGATKVLPKAKIALEILNSPSADSLAEIIVAVGLGQNLAALKALVTEGIQKGHMDLHMRSLAISAGASGPQIEKVAQVLRTQSKRNLATAKDILTNI